jgi:hypothetical protein
MNADRSGQTRLTDAPDATDEMPDWGTNTSPPGSAGIPTPAQLIDKLISTIQNLDHIPQSVKTSLIAPLKGVSHVLNG